MEKYEAKYYLRDVEKCQISGEVEDISEALWDIISDLVEAENPRDQLSTSNTDFSRNLYDIGEWDETGFCACIDDVMITISRV
ncbi:MAG: hypothetical protein M0Q91_12750 [Methanoregula sp.]|jgi:hypothetical protein|nr:hypothetical protein [Methanoregula sp.]